MNKNKNKIEKKEINEDRKKVNNTKVNNKNSVKFQIFGKR